MKRIAFALILMFLLQSCAIGQTTGPSAQDQAAAEPTQPPAQDQAAAEPTEPAAAPDTTAPGAHAVIPSAGSNTPTIMHDNEESKTYKSKGAREGDDFSRNHFERPFTSNTMEYLPQLDIKDFSIASDEVFFYFGIQPVGLDASTNSLTGFYGVEIDRNRDGRGEIFITTMPPYTTDFSTDGVAVFVDTDGDIGGIKVVWPDDNYAGNGYESVLFDLGQNIHPKDPDLAWVRFVEGEKPAIEIAFKRAIFQDEKEAFFWNVWASGTKFDPAMFNLHDHMTVEQAGASNADNSNYPLKDLAAMDNSCRVPFGYEALGSEPMGCSTTVDVKIEEEIQPIPFCDQYPGVCANTSLK